MRVNKISRVLTDRYFESPDYLRMSLAAAMTLGFKGGLFYRNAKLYCINLLLTYKLGCGANCAYCGLSYERSFRHNEKSFIRVNWPMYRLDEIINSISQKKEQVKRICISMITRKRAVQDTIDILKIMRQKLLTPITVLVSPTVMNNIDLIRFRESGADKIGVAIDTATPEIFNKYRGRGINGPHLWEKYWDIYSNSLEIFNGNAGVHLIVGLGETEKEMVLTIQRAHDLGGETHLFSFYPEPGSHLESHFPPPIGQYRRIQLARYLIDDNIALEKQFTYDSHFRLIDYGMSNKQLSEIVASGIPFMTSGCKGIDGKVACNRPYANYPLPLIRNYPFSLSKHDIDTVKKQILKY